jgi:putative SOS response-associated peptidase YedK
MPVILAREDYQRWLNRENKPASVAELLKPFSSERMEAGPVSSKVNAPKNDGPQLINRK